MSDEPVAIAETAEASPMQAITLDEAPEAKADQSPEDTAPEPEEPAPTTFEFIPLLREMHSSVLGLDRYGGFLIKYLGLQSLRVSASLSFVVALHLMADDLDFNDLSTEQYYVLGGVGLMFPVSMIVPFMVSLLIEDLKAELSAAQATSVVAKLFELPHDAMLSTPAGMFVQLISNVYVNLQTLLPALYGGVIPMIIEVSAGVTLIGCLYGWICLPQLVLFVCYTFAAYRAAIFKAERNREMMMVVLSEWGKIMDTAGSYERAHFFDNCELEVANARESFDKIGVRGKVVASGEHYEGMALQSISMVVIVLFSFLVLVSDSADGPEKLALFVYFSVFGFSLSAYGLAVSNVRTAVFEYEALNGFLGGLSEVADLPDARDLEHCVNPSIEFRGVSFSYGGNKILDDISFVLKGGQTLGLVGASGCGKSTILRLLMRFYRTSSGSILVNGHDITELTASSLRRQFSVVTQDSQIFNGTIGDNIGYGKTGSDKESIMAAAKLAELGLEGESELSLEHNCGEKGAKLSGGQQQRVGLARAMLKNGSMYLLDEPTTGLDSLVAQQLQKTLDSLSSHATTIMITHHLMDLRRADEIIYLNRGKIVERGDYDQLVAAKGEFAQQLEARSIS